MSTDFLHGLARAEFGLSDPPTSTYPTLTPSPAHTRVKKQYHNRHRLRPRSPSPEPLFPDVVIPVPPSSSSEDSSDSEGEGIARGLRNGRLRVHESHALPVTHMGGHEFSFSGQHQQYARWSASSEKGKERAFEKEMDERDLYMEEGREMRPLLRTYRPREQSPPPSHIQRLQLREIRPGAVGQGTGERDAAYAPSLALMREGKADPALLAFRLEDLIHKFAIKRDAPVSVAKQALERRRASEERKKVEAAEAQRRAREEREEKERREREEQERRKERKRAKREKQAERREARIRAFDAVRAGDLQGLKREVEEHGIAVIGPEKEGKKGEAMLHVAAGRGDLEVVKYILEKGADMKEVDQAGRKPFHAALAAGHVSIVQYFVATFPPTENDNKGGVYAPPSGTSNVAIAVRSGNAEVVKLVFQTGLVEEKEMNDAGNLLAELPEEKRADMQTVLSPYLPTPVVSNPSPPTSNTALPPSQPTAIPTQPTPTQTAAEVEKLSRKQKKKAEKKAKARAKAQELGLSSQESGTEGAKVDEAPRVLEVQAEVAPVETAAPAPVEAPAPPVMASDEPEAPAEVEVSQTSVEPSEAIADLWKQRFVRNGTASAPPRYTSLPEDDLVDEITVQDWTLSVDDAGFRSFVHFSAPAEIVYQETSEAEPSHVSANPEQPYQPLTATTDPSQSPYSSLSFPHTPSPPMPTPSPPMPAPAPASYEPAPPMPSWQTEVSPVGGLMTGGEKFLFGIMGGGGLPTPPGPVEHQQQVFYPPYEPMQQAYYEPEVGHLPPQEPMYAPPPMYESQPQPYELHSHPYDAQPRPYDSPSQPYDAQHQPYEPYGEVVYQASPVYTNLPISPPQPPPGLPTRPMGTTLNAFAQPFVPRFQSALVNPISPPQPQPTVDQTPMPRPSTPSGLQTPPYVPLSNIISRNSTEASSPVAPNTPASAQEDFRPTVPRGDEAASCASEQVNPPVASVDPTPAQETPSPGRKVYTVRLPGSRSASQSPAPTPQAVEEALPTPEPQEQPPRPISVTKAKGKKWVKKNRGPRPGAAAGGTNSDVSVAA